MTLVGEGPVLGKDEIFVFGLVDPNAPGGPTVSVGMVVSSSKVAAQKRIISSLATKEGLTASVYSLGNMLRQLPNTKFISDSLSAMAWAIKQQNPDPLEGE